MDGQSQVRAGRRTCLAGQALLPREAPMRPLCSREDGLPAAVSRFFLWRACHRQHHSMGSHHLEPAAPNVRAWPINPKDPAMSKSLCQLDERLRWPQKRCRGTCLGRRDGPENGDFSAVVWWWNSFLDTGHAAGIGDNRRCEPHTPDGTSHRAPDARSWG